MPPNGTDRLKEGMATRRAVLGDQHVDRMEAGKNGFDGPFQDLITEAAWGHVWSRPDWTQARALDRHHRASRRAGALRGDGDARPRHRPHRRDTGATSARSLLHVAIYAGVPAANHAIKIAKQALADVAAGRAD